MQQLFSREGWDKARAAQVLERVDLDGDGKIGFNEWVAATVDLNPASSKTAAAHAKALFDQLDVDGDGKIHLSELLEFIDGNDLSDRSCPAHADADLEAIWHELGGAGDVEDHGGGHHFGGRTAGARETAAAEAPAVAETVGQLRMTTARSSDDRFEPSILHAEPK